MNNQISLEDRITIRLYGRDAYNFFSGLTENPETRTEAVHRLALWISESLQVGVRFGKRGNINLVGSTGSCYICPPHWLASHLT